MSKNNKSITDEQLAQYLDQEVPMQQLEADIPPFMKAQLDFANSPHSKKAKSKQRVYKKRWIKKGGIDE